MAYYNIDSFDTEVLPLGIYSTKTLSQQMPRGICRRTFIAGFVAIEKCGDNTLKFHTAMSKNEYFTK